jgi:hypothetical protein
MVCLQNHQLKGSIMSTLNSMSTLSNVAQSLGMNKALGTAFEQTANAAGRNADEKASENTQDQLQRGMAKTMENMQANLTKGTADLQASKENNLMSQALSLQEATNKLALKGADLMKSSV